jgi:hypothetical protein
MAGLQMEMQRIESMLASFPMVFSISFGDSRGQNPQPGSKFLNSLLALPCITELYVNVLKHTEVLDGRNK